MENNGNRLLNKKKKKIKLFLVLFLVLILGVTVGFIFDKSSILEKNEALEFENNTLNEIRESEKKNTLNENNIVDIQNIENNTTEDEVSKDENNLNQNKELFEDYYDKSEKILEKMTLEEKVGQMFYARYPKSGADKEIIRDNPGGYILFADDFKNQTKSSILKKIEQHQENSKIKMFMGVDEEGGTVVRVSNFTAFRSSKFKSPQQLWNEGKLQRIIEDSTEKSKLLKSIGLNTNFAPVVDVPTKKTSFIYKRSYGRGADNTAIYAKRIIENMNNDNMISVMKHFPGYGDNVDTHTGIAIDDRYYQNFEDSDFKPFIAGINAKGPMILVSHNIVKCMDEKLPASLSKDVHDILRNELNFSGLIITDDLAMDAVKGYVENGKAATMAVIAGNDLIISSDFINQKKEIVDAVENNEIPMEYIDNAVRRILSCKYAYGIIN